MQAIHTLRSGNTVDNRVEMPEEDQREKNFLGKPESSRKVVKPERENLKKNLKENAKREKEKERRIHTKRRVTERANSEPHCS